MDGNLATTYTLIHAFLTKRSHSKAAEALKKAAKDVVILKDNLSIDGPQLDEIIWEWKSLKALASSDSSSDSSSSSSSSSTSSDSDSSSSDSSSSDSSSASKKKKQKAKPPKVSSSISSSSSSSDSDSEPTPKTTVTPVAKVKAKSPKVPSSSSSSSSDSDSDSEPETTLKTTVAKVKPTAKKSPRPEKKKPAASSSSSSSSSDDSGAESDDESSDAESAPPKKPAATERDSSRTLSTPSIADADAKAVAAATPAAAVKKKSVASDSDSDSSDSSSSSDSDSDAEAPVAVKKEQAEKAMANAAEELRDNTQVTKRRRTDEGGASVATAKVVNASAAGDSKPGKPARKSNTPFQRVNPDKVLPTIMMDNRYTVKAGPSNDYGQRAHNDLIVTRGAGFRKEKNKKKRGSYRGGEITMESHSFKFDDDD